MLRACTYQGRLESVEHATLTGAAYDPSQTAVQSESCMQVHSMLETTMLILQATERAALQEIHVPCVPHGERGVRTGLKSDNTPSAGCRSGSATRWKPPAYLTMAPA